LSQNLQLLVDGIDLTRFVDQENWSIAQNWSRQGDTASFLLTDEHAVRNVLSFVVGPLATVVFTDVGLGQTLFSGVVPKPQVKFPSPNLAEWNLDCVDWTYLADRALVVGDYTGQTADQLAIALTAQANCGITAATPANGGFVFPGQQIPRVQFNFETLTQAWTKISKLASITSTYGWYVDENRALHFYPIANAVSSGQTLTDDITKHSVAGFANYETDSFAYEWDATSIRNTITVRGADYSQQQTDLFVGNGSQVSFPLTFVPDANNIAQATLAVGGVTKTVAAQSGGSATTQWVIVGNAANQWFLQANTDTAPADLVIVQFVYPFLQPVLSRVASGVSVAKFKTLPNGGAFAYYIADSNLPTLLAAQKRGQREVATYAQPTERVQMSVTRDFAGHFRAGQLVTVVNGMVPDSDNANLPGINDQFLVLQNRVQGAAGLLRSYQITAVRT
jgi:hypothetical protein